MLQYSANMTGGKLKKIINKAPTGPGVYIFTGGRRKLYIGKAANLRARLLSYLKTTDTRILKMLSLATDVKTLKTDSEIEALITESQYVKRYKPAFNIMLRDDKNFFYVVSTKEKWPKIFITHRPTLFGPFTDGTALKTTLRYLRRIFPYCTCKKPHNNFCLNYHIGKCLGFCCLKDIASLRITNYELNTYQKNVKAIKDILNGKKTSLLKELEKEMVQLGKIENFEEAIELRGKIEKIKRVFENARIIQNIPYYDISNNHGGDALLGLNKFLKPKQLPRRIEGYDVANIQGQHAVGVMVVFTNGKPNKSQYRRFKIRHQEHKNPLLQKHYGRGSIATIKESADDTAMLREVLTRRFRHPEWQMPDLVIIDGGKAQLNAARSIITQSRRFGRLPDPLASGLHNYSITIIALTKDEKHRGIKIYVSGKKTATPLSQLPIPIKNRLLHVNSEAHRFAISYYRKIHRKKALRPY
ncbi:MAG: hypothetical protein HY505_02465 [Candidatus Yanofskybacteria bacterium]|nr:hypothetical protein [Candidatus Yanofskybacteria bacterium]